MSKRPVRPLTAMTIAFINIAAICNIKNFPLLGEFGFSVVFLLALASIIFFIPAALISAELASGWPDKGVYTWVSKALGERFGFLAIWLQWIENVMYYPTVLSFIAATLSYAINPDLMNHKLYVIPVILGIFWGATLVNFLGMKISGLISLVTALFGTILPVIGLLCLGTIWLSKGFPSQIAFSWESFFPKFSSLNSLVLFSGLLFGLSGVEMSAVHAKDVVNPRVSYPKGIFLSAISILGFSAVGGLSIGVIVPSHEIELASGGMEAFRAILAAFQIDWMMPYISLIIVFGALGMLSTWIVGPSRGLYATAMHGNLPPLFHKSNKYKMPTAILILQGIIVTVLTFTLFLFPSVNSFYWIFLSLAAILYQLMYILMFISAIVLRYKYPEVHREYKIPCGNIGMWIACTLGLSGSIFGFILGLLPPSQFSVGDLVIFETFLGVSLVIFCAVPFLIYALRKPSWHLKDDAA